MLPTLVSHRPLPFASEFRTMTRKLKRIAPLQLGIVAGVFYALISLIIVQIFVLIAIASAFAPHTGGLGAMQAGIGVGMGLFFAVLAPIMYGAMGFILARSPAWSLISWQSGARRNRVTPHEVPFSRHWRPVSRRQPPYTDCVGRIVAMLLLDASQSVSVRLMKDVSI